MAIKQRFPWVTVSAVVATGVVAAVAWLQLPEPSAKPALTSRQPVLGLTHLDAGTAAEVMAERLAAYDPTPLFLHTAMNSQPPANREIEPAATDGPFQALPAELVKAGGLRFPLLVTVPASPVQGLALGEQQQSPLEMGRLDGVGKALSDRLGQVEVVATQTGRVVLRQDLKTESALPPGDWQPMELMGSVSRAGLVGDLVITTSSGEDTIDDFFRSHLSKNMRIGDRLPAGVYVFRIGP